MFKIEDYVLYGMQGVCRVSDIIARTTDGVSAEYYVLTPVYGNGAVVFVPKDNETLCSRMHALLSKEEMKSLWESIQTLPALWDADANKRKDLFKNTLLSGERTGVVSLIKTLYIHRAQQKEKGKKLHLNDERYLKEAEKMFFAEAAVVTGRTPEDVAADFGAMFG